MCCRGARIGPQLSRHWWTHARDRALSCSECPSIGLDRAFRAAQPDSGTVSRRAQAGPGIGALQRACFSAGRSASRWWISASSQGLHVAKRWIQGRMDHAPLYPTFRNMQPLRTCRDQPAAVSKAGTPNILTTTISPSPPGSAQHRRAPALPLAQNPKLYSSTAGSSRRGLPAVHTPGARSTLQFKKHCSGRLLLLVLETVGGKSRQVRKGCMLRNVGYRGA